MKFVNSIVVVLKIVDVDFDVLNVVVVLNTDDVDFDVLNEVVVLYAVVVETLVPNTDDVTRDVACVPPVS